MKVDARRNGPRQLASPSRDPFGQRADQEFAVLRHHKLRRGMHKAFVAASRNGVWLVYEKIGTRVVGDFAVVHPEGGGPPDYDESYRLARYASYAHWQDTRRPAGMMGDGPLTALGAEGGATRQRYLLDSDGAYYLIGNIAPDIPVHFPALNEQYERTDEPGSAHDGPRPVRYDVPVPGDEILAMDICRIPKGAFDRYHGLSRDGLWPLMSKMGVRVLGQWKVVHPPAPARSVTAPGDYDEVLTLTRYASYQHWQSARDPAALIGNGGDYDAYSAAFAERLHLTQTPQTRFLAGELYRSPPAFIPPLEEHYRRVDV
jgi:hypothetical protein